MQEVIDSLCQIIDPRRNFFEAYKIYESSNSNEGIKNFTQPQRDADHESIV